MTSWWVVTRHVSRGIYVVSTASGRELSDSVLSIISTTLSNSSLAQLAVSRWIWRVDNSYILFCVNLHFYLTRRYSTSVFRVKSVIVSVLINWYSMNLAGFMSIKHKCRSIFLVLLTCSLYPDKEQQHGQTLNYADSNFGLYSHFISRYLRYSCHFTGRWHQPYFTG